jgi:hypothetical protein
MSDFIDVRLLSGCINVQPKSKLRLSAVVNGGYYAYDSDVGIYSEDQDFHKQNEITGDEYRRLCDILGVSHPVTKKPGLSNSCWKELKDEAPYPGERIFIKHDIIGEVIAYYEETLLKRDAFNIEVVMKIIWGDCSMQIDRANIHQFQWKDIDE